MYKTLKITIELKVKDTPEMNHLIEKLIEETEEIKADFENDEDIKDVSIDVEVI